MAERAGIVYVDVVPDLKGFEARVDGAARRVRPVGIRTRLDSKFGQQLDGERQKAQRSLDSLSTGKAKDQFRSLGEVVRAEFSRMTGSATAFGGGQILENFGGKAALALGLVGVAAVKTGAEYNQAMSAVKAVTGATAAQMEELREQSIAAGGETIFTAKEAAVAQTELARAGVATSDILSGALGGSLSLAAAGQLNLAESAEIAGKAMNIFSLSGSDVPRIADALAAGANKSAADVRGLGMSLAQAGGVAATTGLSLEDTIGTLSLFADNAIAASDGGTSLRTMLSRLVPQSNDAAETMRRLGLSFYDSSGRFIGIEALAGQLREALSGLTDQQRQSAVVTMFGLDAQRAALALYKEGAEGVREYVDAVSDVGAADRTASTMTDNLAGDIERLGGAVQGFLIGAGQMDGVLRPVVQGATKLVDQLAKIPGAGPLIALGTAVFGLASRFGFAVSSIDSGLRVLARFRKQADETAAAVDSAGGYRMGAVADGANVAAAATERVAAAMGGVAGASAEAGTAGTAAMSAIGTAASAALVPVGALSTALSTVGVTGAAGALAQIGQIGGAVSGLGRGPFIDAESWEVPVTPVRELGAAANTTTQSVGRLRSVAGSLGNALRTAGGSVANAASSLRGFIGGLPKLVTGLGAAVVAFEGLNFAVDENNRGFQETLDIISQDSDAILAMLDPAKKFNAEAARIAMTLDGLDDIGPLSAVDRIKDFFGLFGEGEERENQMAVRAQQLKDLGAALERVPAVRAKAALDQIKEALIAQGTSAEEAESILRDLYAQIDRREAIKRATSSVEGLTSAVDEFGYAVDMNKSKVAQWTDSLGNVLDPANAALNAQAGLEEANRRVADAEAEVDRIRKQGTSGTEEYAKRQRELAEAVESVASAHRSEMAALRDRNNAQRDLDELERQRARLDPARHPNQIRELDEAIRDQRDKVADANDQYLDAVASRKEAENGLRDKQAESKQQTDDLAQAERDLEAARRDQVAAAQRKQEAEAALLDLYRQNPPALKAAADALDGWVQQGLIATETAKQWKEELLKALEAALALEQAHETPPPATPASPSAALPPDASRLFDIFAALFGAKKHGIGGMVTGSGTGDTVPALLTPGEYVLRRAAAQAIGVDRLNLLNRADKPHRFASGGLVIGGRSSTHALPAGPPTAAPSGVDSAVLTLIAALRGDIARLLAVVANMANVTYAPTINARPDQVAASMREAFAETRRDAWANHGRWING